MPDSQLTSISESISTHAFKMKGFSCPPHKNMINQGYIPTQWSLLSSVGIWVSAKISAWDSSESSPDRSIFFLQKDKRKTNSTTQKMEVEGIKQKNKLWNVKALTWFCKKSLSFFKCPHYFLLSKNNRNVFSSINSLEFRLLLKRRQIWISKVINIH